jgi:hypothetical protein
MNGEPLRGFSLGTGESDPRMDPGAPGQGLFTGKPYRLIRNRKRPEVMLRET